jgi:hypothetical protein
MIYYAQNAMPILKTAIWIVILERALTFALWLLLLIPAAAITWMLPRPMHEAGGIITILIAAILAGPLRAAFLKPLFLIMMMVRFHALIENQPINEEWDARLAMVSDKFRDLGTRLGTQAKTSFESPVHSSLSPDLGEIIQGTCRLRTVMAQVTRRSPDQVGGRAMTLKARRHALNNLVLALMGFDG